jgi:hypothetical protein
MSHTEQLIDYRRCVYNHQSPNDVVNLLFEDLPQVTGQMSHPVTTRLDGKDVIECVIQLKFNDKYQTHLDNFITAYNNKGEKYNLYTIYKPNLNTENYNNIVCDLHITEA